MIFFGLDWEKNTSYGQKHFREMNNCLCKVTTAHTICKQSNHLRKILFLAYCMYLMISCRVWISKTKLIHKKILLQAKIFLDLWIILWKMGRVLTTFCELIWTSIYYESLWNHNVIQQGVFNRLKMIYYTANSINDTENSWSI